MDKKHNKKEMKSWQLAVGIAIGVVAFCLPFLLPQSLPKEGKLTMLLLGLAILAASVLAFASRHGGVRCPNCGTRWGGNSFGMAARTHEGIFRCPHCGAMIPMK